MNNILKEKANELGLLLSDNEIERFNKYYEFLVSYNENVNLTAITDYEEVCIKHFLDSISVLKFVDLKDNVSMIDIGTGAGFPSVPLKIMRNNIDLTLMDSLNKRLDFLKQLSELVDIDATYIHSRAEDITDEHRESFDFGVSRAVASLDVLSEYVLPYIKVGGKFLAYKGKGYEDEIKDASRAIEILGGKIIDTYSFDLLGLGERNIICIEKIQKTDKKYPRNSKKIKTKKI